MSLQISMVWAQKVLPTNKLLTWSIQSIWEDIGLARRRDNVTEGNGHENRCICRFLVAPILPVKWKVSSRVKMWGKRLGLKFEENIWDGPCTEWESELAGRALWYLSCWELGWVPAVSLRLWFSLVTLSGQGTGKRRQTVGPSRAGVFQAAEKERQWGREFKLSSAISLCSHML